MMEPNISTFIYIIDVTYVSSIYEHQIHPKLNFLSKYFTKRMQLGFFMLFYVQFFLKGSNVFFLGGTKTFRKGKKRNHVSQTSYPRITL